MSRKQLNRSLGKTRPTTKIVRRRMKTKQRLRKRYFELIVKAANLFDLGQELPLEEQKDFRDLSIAWFDASMNERTVAASTTVRSDDQRATCSSSNASSLALRRRAPGHALAVG
jgi:hypothetical protein